MSSLTDSAPRPDDRRSYFFLSYAHSAPSIQQPTNRYASTDPWVHKFFQHLAEAVERRSEPGAGMRPGFIDQEVQPGADWNATLADALGKAEVFVPLYSPSYFKNPWPMREHAAFQQRLAESDAKAPDDRIIPVLWIAFPKSDSSPEVQRAVALGEDVPEYVENGLRALCMLSYYDPAYRQIVDRLADRILRVASDPTLTPKPDLVLESAPVPDVEPRFVALVLAPTKDEVPSTLRSGVYGATSAAWRPFGEQILPAAEYVTSTAERLGLLPTKIADLEPSSDLFNRYPTVLLIDPLTLDTSEGAGMLRTVAKAFPIWVRPLVVIDEAAPDSTRADRLAAEALEVLGQGGVGRPERVSQLREFVDIMPTLVTEARRQFLKYGPVSPPSGQPAARLRRTKPDIPPTASAGTVDDE